ncbi:MAG: hypothetical protein ACR2K2_05390 [Mycobacteriales bacterium]
MIEAIQTALTGDGFQVRLLRATQDGDFAELQVSRHGQITQLDLGRDWRAHQAVTLDIGPVLHLDDAVGSKTTALLGRALPRDYIDIAAALSRYPRRKLLELAFDRDRGLRVVDVALAAQRLDRLDDELFLPYLRQLGEVADLREKFADWPRNPAHDATAQAAYDTAHRPDRSAVQPAAAAYPVPLDQALQHQPGPPPPPTRAPPSSPRPELRGPSPRHGR